MEEITQKYSMRGEIFRAVLQWLLFADAPYRIISLPIANLRAYGMRPYNMMP